MSFATRLLEAYLGAVADKRPEPLDARLDPRQIFVLRNNDIGDLLVTTPLFEALSELFPRARIVAGVGDWNRPVLENNPYVSEVLPVNAPWMNKYTSPSRTHSMVASALRYIYSSDEAREIERRKFDIGIDVFGTQLGSLLLLRGKAKFRVGVRGYKGGHSAAHAFVDFDLREHVSRANLRVAELLGATSLPAARPQLFLSSEEKQAASQQWKQLQAGQAESKTLRVVVSPGAGLPNKCWPLGYYQALIESVAKLHPSTVAVIGSASQLSDCESAVGATKYATALTPALRETFALISQADLVVCNSSMSLHVAAAFRVPTLVLLGDSFDSASEHSALWGYRENCIMLGRDIERPTIATPEEALHAVALLTRTAESRETTA